VTMRLYWVTMRLYLITFFAFGLKEPFFIDHLSIRQ
jgi:hypothetical protein